MSDTILCPVCETENDAGDSHCVICGEEIAAAPASAEDAPEVDAEETSHAEGEDSEALEDASSEPADDDDASADDEDTGDDGEAGDDDADDADDSDDDDDADDDAVESTDETDREDYEEPDGLAAPSDATAEIDLDDDDADDEGAETEDDQADEQHSDEEDSDEADDEDSEEADDADDDDDDEDSDGDYDEGDEDSDGDDDAPAEADDGEEVDDEGDGEAAPAMLYSPVDGKAYEPGSPEYEEGFGPHGEELVADVPDAAYAALEDEYGEEGDEAADEPIEEAPPEPESPRHSAQFLAAFPKRHKEQPQLEPLPTPGALLDPATLTVYYNRQPYVVHEIDNDETLIGRADPRADAYPDIDLTDIDDGAVVSRKHAYVYRQNKNYTLFVTSNAGTQLNSELLELGARRKLNSGDIIVLAGAIAVKFDLPSDA